MTDTLHALGRIEVLDERDKNFPVSAVLAEAKDTLPPIPKRFWWADGWWGNQGQAPHCFLDNALVTMADGSQKQIKDIVAGDEVITHMGNVKKVKHTVVNDYDGEICGVYFRMNYEPIYVTPNHPFYVSKVGIDWSSKQSETYGRLVLQDTGWVNAKDLKNNRYYLRQWVDSNFINPEITEYEGVRLDYNFGRFVGLYLAEGWSRRNEISFAFHINEKDYHTFITEQCLEIFNLPVKIENREKVNTTVVTCYDSKIKQTMESLCGKYSDSKYLNINYLSCPKEFLEGIIQGFLDGDGHVNDNGKWTLTTVSRPLSNQLYRIMLFLGFNCSIRVQHQKDRKPCYRIYKYNSGPSNRRIVDNQFLLSEVTEISSLHYVGKVYTLEVEDDESYLVNDIAVHNCVAYAWMHYLEDGPVIQDSLTESRSKPFYNPKQFYDLCQKNDQWDGEAYDGTSVRAGAKILNHLGIVKSYRWAFTLEDVLSTVKYIGPMVVGTRWYSEMSNPTPAGILRARGTMQGGHAYVINGLDETTGLFRIKNSWGRDWGKQGYAFIPFEDFEKLLLNGGEACIAFENKMTQVPKLLLG